ncbi:MAG: serine/threonine-protein kinase [Planctomycetota bacterium]|nr:serine/threonine-protein kinase [Planctomycetota bacterium]
MITYDDLLAARYLNKKHPHLRTALEKVLEFLDVGRGQGNLLQTLVINGMISRSVASDVHKYSINHNRTRALNLFIELLKDAGIRTKDLRAALRTLKDRSDAISLGEELSKRELIARSKARSLRYQTRMALDRYRSLQVQKYLKKIRKGLRRTTVLNTVGRDDDEDTDIINDDEMSDSQELVPRKATVSDSQEGLSFDAFDDDENDESDVNLNPVHRDEGKKILTRTLCDSDANFEAPRFFIPEWVDMSDPLTGKNLKEYRFLGKIGMGAMGNVYLCDSNHREGPIALKLLSNEADVESKERFKREVFIQGLLPPHERIIELYDAGRTESGYSYLAMEFFDSTDLFKILEVEKRIDAPRAVSITIQVAEALNWAHKAKIVHRDLKPANILVSNVDGDSKLADFGIALNLEMGGLETFVYKSMDGTVTGTAEFVSPEQALGGNLDTRSDLYSLGVVLYLMLSGRLPFESESSMGYLTSHMMEDPYPIAKACADAPAPAELYKITNKLLEKEPDDRFQTGEELVEALSQIKFDGERKPFGGLWKALGLRARS